MAYGDDGDTVRKLVPGNSMLYIKMEMIQVRMDHYTLLKEAKEANRFTDEL
jgi:hypothetical protein